MTTSEYVAKQGEGNVRVLSFDRVDHAQAESGGACECAQHEDRRQLQTSQVDRDDPFRERDESSEARPCLLYGVFDRSELGQINLLRRWGRAHVQQFVQQT